MIDNIWEEVAYWQRLVEDRNLEIIYQHELATSTEVDAARIFTNEMKRRNLK